MSDLYTPLAILEQIQVPKQTREKAKQASVNPFLFDFMTGNQTILNLDDFLSWVLGSTFCKTRYEGPYQGINSLLLRLYHKKEKQEGSRYQECRDSYRKICCIRGILTCWEKYKQVYRFDPDFTEELLETTAVEIPLEVLKRLPFRCYYLDTEELSGFQSALGFFVYLGYDQQTGLPNLGILAIHPPAPWETQCRIYPHLFSAHTLKRQGLLADTDQGQVLAFRQSQSANPDQRLLLFLLQGMLYLTSHEPDVTESPKRHTVNTGRQKPHPAHKPLVLTDVGIRYGTVICKQKRETLSGSSGQTGISRPKRQITSHVRRAHWHHYWTGKGRTILTVKWIPPVFVSGTGKDLPVTIHRVTR